MPTIRDGKRRQGRQRTRWRDEIESFASEDWKRQAADKDEWRRLGTVDSLRLMMMTMMMNQDKYFRVQVDLSVLSSSAPCPFHRR